MHEEKKKTKELEERIRNLEEILKLEQEKAEILKKLLDENAITAGNPITGSD